MASGTKRRGRLVRHRRRAIWMPLAALLCLSLAASLWLWPKRVTATIPVTVSEKMIKLHPFSAASPDAVMPIAFLQSGGVAPMTLNGPGYTGEWQRPDATLHLRARTYDPSEGRFLQRDPLDTARLNPQLPIDSNRYLYARANPVLNTDPSGMIPNVQYERFINDEHPQRNQHNICWSKPPDRLTNSETNTYFDREGNRWIRDETWSEERYHGGYATFRLRNPDGSGMQCSYDDKGNLVNTGNYQGTYDFCAPFHSNGGVDIAGVICHYFEDVVPHGRQPNYVDNMTIILDIECANPKNPILPSATSDIDRGMSNFLRDIQRTRPQRMGR